MWNGGQVGSGLVAGGESVEGSAEAHGHHEVRRTGPWACLTIPVCRATPCTHSRGTGRRPKYVQYEGLRPAPREHAPDAARPPSGRRREWSDRP
ncbi:hypothetical protein GCM10023100_44230 [Actinocorallia cavernae]|uniref:Uncharacterized protein n=1 Tax=Actinocorallia cavernae TaxID=328075 RepID=A0ABP8SWE0_9ACTN